MKRLDSESWKILGVVTMIAVMALCGLVLKEKISFNMFMVGEFVFFPLSCFCFLCGYITETTEGTSRATSRITASELKQESSFMKHAKAEDAAEEAKQNEKRDRRAKTQSSGSSEKSGRRTGRSARLG